MRYDLSRRAMLMSLSIAGAAVDNLALAAAVLLRCDADNGERAFALLDVLYERQSQWTQAEDPMAALGRIAAISGLGVSGFEACLADEALTQRILRQRQEASEVYGVRSTPTFLVNGERSSTSRGKASATN